MRITIDNEKRRLDQWDTGQRLILEGIPAGAHVDFARPGTEPLGRETYEQDGNIYVNVPDAILQDAGGFGAWFYVREGDRGETVRFWPGTALPRPKPADYIHSDEELKAWEQLRNEIDLRHQCDYGKPGTDTPGAVGGFYIDLDSGDVYKCIAADDGKYQWSGLIENNYVIYNANQSLPEHHKMRARLNIGAASVEELETVKAAVSENVAYYSSLSQAVEDVNSGVRNHALTDASAAKVKVFTAHTGALTVMLLADVSESALISVSKPMDLVINGKTLSLTDVSAYLSFTAEGCAIDGRAAGSAIVKNFGEADASCYFVDTSASLAILGGSYRVTGADTSPVTTIRAGSACGELVMEGCTVAVENTADAAGMTRVVQTQAAVTVLRDVTLNVDSMGNAHGVFGKSDFRVMDSTIRANTFSDIATKRAYGILLTGGSLRIADSRVQADAPGSEADTSSATGITGTMDIGNVFVDNCYVTGTHSGISVGGNLYVGGGTYTGYSHGGIYFINGPGGINYVNDAVIRCGNYEGVHDYAEPRDNHSPLSAFYIGGGDKENNSNVTVYMDGCSIEGTDNTAFVVRGTSGETNNRLYISNSVITKGTYVRVDNDTHRLYVGTGMSITEDMIRNADSTPATGRAEYSDNLYRRHHGDAPMGGRDYDALRRKTGSGGSGKSAYAYAQEGGYTGTETEFAEKLAQEAPRAFYITVSGDAENGYAVDKTKEELLAAHEAGCPLYAVYPDNDQLILPLNSCSDGWFAFAYTFLVETYVLMLNTNGDGVSVSQCEIFAATAEMVGALPAGFVSGATVGQTVRITSVDDNGVPTAWEAVDLAGGGVEPELIVDVTTTEAAAQVLVNADINGEAFELIRYRVFVTFPPTGYDANSKCRLGPSPYVYYIETDLWTEHERGCYIYTDAHAPRDYAMYSYAPVPVFSAEMTRNVRITSWIGTLTTFYVFAVDEAYPVPTGTRIRIWGERV